MSQIPALIVSLAAGLLVSKGGTRGSADKAVLGQLGGHPRALFVASALLFVLGLDADAALSPLREPERRAGLPRLRHSAQARRGAGGRGGGRARAARNRRAPRAKNSVKESLRTHEIELVLGKQLAARLLSSHSELSTRVARMRRKFAMQYGFVVPEIKVSDSLSAPPKCYQIRIHGAVVARQEVRIGEYLIINGDGKRPGHCRARRRANRRSA